MGAIEEFYAARQARLEALANGHVEFDTEIDWHEVITADYELEWLIEGLWPTAKHLHLFAAHKTGKSLISLAMGIGLAIGVDPFTGANIKPHDVTYLDREMTAVDLQERVLDMGFTDADSERLKRLHYHFYPKIGYLDTPEGGNALMRLLQSNGSDVVIIDTLSRVVKGEENSNDTYKDFYNYTGQQLKAAGIAMLRLDHEGHTGGHSRGASSKADDVDLVYQLKATDDGLEIIKQFARVAYVRPTIILKQTDDPLGWRETEFAWPSGTLEKAQELDALGIDMELSVRKTQRALRDKGVTPGKTVILAAALKYRRERLVWP